MIRDFFVTPPANWQAARKEIIRIDIPMPDFVGKICSDCKGTGQCPVCRGQGTVKHLCNDRCDDDCPLENTYEPCGNCLTPECWPYLNPASDGKCFLCEGIGWFR